MLQLIRKVFNRLVINKVVKAFIEIFLNGLYEKITAEWILRLGLAAVFLYSGFSLIMNPGNWIGYMPSWFLQTVNVVIPSELYLRLQGCFELMMAIVFIVSYAPRSLLLFTALIASMEFAGILFFYGVDAVTFRDIGLFSASSALVLMIAKK